MMGHGTAQNTLPHVRPCASEPIHRLGTIQPYGFLLSVGKDWVVLRASENVHRYLSLHHWDIIDKPLGAFLCTDVAHSLRGCMQSSDTGVVARLFAQRLVKHGPLFDVAIHRADREIVLEFEFSVDRPGGSLGTLRSMIFGLKDLESAQAMSHEAARQVRTYAGYDRVLVYRFDDDGTGEVIAETAKDGRTPLLGLRYPASDIPTQARELYERNYLRTIADIDAVPVPIAQSRKLLGETLDLSMSALRSVSPTHVEYLRNMNVRSSMSISIMRQGRLWGLIACHNDMPVHLDFEMRSTAEMFGQVFSCLLDERLRTDEAAIDRGAQVIHDAIATKFSHPSAIFDDVSGFLVSAAQYMPADGIGVYFSGTVAMCGDGPTPAQFRCLIEFLSLISARKVFSTSSLANVYPSAPDLTTHTAGLLAIPISRTERDFLVFFRQEVTRTTTWAGEPVMSKATDETGSHYQPRTSFDAWREIVRGQSKPWSPRELRLAEVMRATLTQIAFQLSDQAGPMISRVVHSQEIKITELNHRNRNILGLVRGLIAQSAASASDVASLVASLDGRIRSLASAQDNLSSGNQMPSSLHALLRAEIGAYAPSNDNLMIIGPDVLLAPKAYLAMAMVVHELVTNATKYGALTRAEGCIKVDVANDDHGDVSILWQEMGGPGVLAPTRRGFGSTILEQSIPSEVQGTSRLLFRKDGFAFEIMLPRAVATCIATPAREPPVQLVFDGPIYGNSSVELSQLLACTLLVEDNLFIAIDAENMLVKLGARSVEIVKTVSEALAAIATRVFTFALLDVNLDGENSLPIGLTLLAKGVPFAFGAGYGDIIGMPRGLEQSELLSKPYSRIGMRAVLRRIIADTSTTEQESLNKQIIDIGRISLFPIAIVSPTCTGKDDDELEPER